MISSRFLFLIIPLLMGCNLPQDEAIGLDEEIVILCEDENFDIAQPILDQTFGRIVFTPQHEPLYTYRRITPSQLTENLKVKNLMIFTRLEVYSQISEQVRSILPDTTLTTIREDRNGIYLVKNAYAAGQVLLIIAAKSPPDLRNRLESNQDRIFELFENAFLQRQLAFIYRSGERTELAESYHDQYGWYLRIMHDFVEIRNDPARHFVWLGRDFPFRWLTVSWLTPVDTLDLEAQGRRLLERTFGTLLEDIRINRDYLQEEERWLSSYSALRFAGLWEHKTETKGGPFIAYAFYEPVMDRIYLLSGLVHAPDRRKVPYLRQLDVIMYTFSDTVYDPHGGN